MIFDMNSTLGAWGPGGLVVTWSDSAVAAQTGGGQQPTTTVYPFIHSRARRHPNVIDTHYKWIEIVS